MLALANASLHVCVTGKKTCANGDLRPTSCKIADAAALSPADSFFVATSYSIIFKTATTHTALQTDPHHEGIFLLKGKPYRWFATHLWLATNRSPT